MIRIFFSFFLLRMPELLEVESARHLADTLRWDHNLGFLSSELGGGPLDGQWDSKVYEVTEKVKGQSDYEALQGSELVSVGRQGKQLWLYSVGRNLCYFTSV